MTDARDRWYRWLRDVRFGGDADYRERDLAEYLYPWRDEILARADVKPGETLLDVGTGDGLVAAAALDLVGPSGRVIFSDISADLLDYCREAAAAGGMTERCEFVLASADSLTGIADASVDVVTTRSVLIYVKDKAAAFREFYRVLRPGGRASLFEPVNRLMDDADGYFVGYDVRPVAAAAAKLRDFYQTIQPRGKDPMIDFDDRDLFRLAEHAGFPEISLNLRVSVQDRRDPCPWDRFLRSSGNPLVPPFGEVLDRALKPREREAFSAHLRPLVESGTGQHRMALAFLTATKH